MENDGVRAARGREYFKTGSVISGGEVEVSTLNINKTRVEIVFWV